MDRAMVDAAFCTRGLSQDKCVEVAKQDQIVARSFGQSISNQFAADYREYVASGDCPCAASWAAKYQSGLGRV